MEVDLVEEAKVKMKVSDLIKFFYGNIGVTG